MGVGLCGKTSLEIEINQPKCHLYFQTKVSETFEFSNKMSETFVFSDQFICLSKSEVHGRKCNAIEKNDGGKWAKAEL